MFTMTDYCIICETEPIEVKPEGMNFSWFREIQGVECICPWCIKDIHDSKDRKIVEKLRAALSIYKEDEFSRSFLENILK